MQSGIIQALNDTKGGGVVYISSPTSFPTKISNVIASTTTHIIYILQSVSIMLVLISFEINRVDKKS